MEVRFKKLVPEAIDPHKAHPTDAGFDLAAISCRVDEWGNYVYGTGLAFEIPRGYVGLLFPRSSCAKKDLVMSNCVGVIDSGYRGEVTAKFRPELFHAKDKYLPSTEVSGTRYGVSDRICQLIILPYPEIEFVESQELSGSDRGSGSYGSTGR